MNLFFDLRKYFLGLVEDDHIMPSFMQKRKSVGFHLVK